MLSSKLIACGHQKTLDQDGYSQLLLLNDFDTGDGDRGALGRANVRVGEAGDA